MSTQSYTPNQQAPHQQPPRQQGGGPSWFRIWIVVIGTAAAVALVALAVALSHSHSSPAPATSGAPTLRSTKRPRGRDRVSRPSAVACGGIGTLTPTR